MFMISLPFFGKFISYPLVGLPKLFISSDLKDVKSAVVLTGGIYKFIRDYFANIIDIVVNSPNYKYCVSILLTLVFILLVISV